MAKYWLEVVGLHGSKHIDGKSTLTETRKQACRQIGKSKNITVWIFDKTDGFNKEVDKIWYEDAFENPFGNYSYSTAGYWIHHYSGKSKGKRKKLSAKTGKPMDVNKYWKHF